MPTTTSGFSDLCLHPELLHVLAGLGYDEPTPIQREAIPTVVAGRDLLGQAATGTGKTAAFALPILHRLAEGNNKGKPAALVLVPTRELAIQVSDAIKRYGKTLGVKVLAVYGGAPISTQLQALKQGVDVVVATPGRAVDHIKRNSMRLDDLEMVVLDEADEMLDMGFAEELDAVLAATPDTRQTVLFSATLPTRIDAIARRHLRDPERIRIAREAPVEGQVPRVTQAAYLVGRNYKAAAVGRILDVENPTAGLIFCRTRDQVDTLTEQLNALGHRAEALHGGMGQEQRDRVMNRLRSEIATLLIATDVAARGLDIDHLTHVINFDVPSSPETYVHRIGRVGRAGREGVAITLADPREQRVIKTIERTTKQTIKVRKLPTLGDVRQRRMQMTAAEVRKTIAAGEFERFRGLVDDLAAEHDPTTVALAAIKLAHEASGAASGEQEIPEPIVDLRDRKRDRDRKGPPSKDGKPSNRANTGPMKKIYVGVGRSAGVRPGDLVGAIANESHLSGKQIGDIDISDRFSLVEVPADSVDKVIDALKNTTVKGKRANVRREKFDKR